MFSGIIECVQPILRSLPSAETLRLFVKKPDFFDDLHLGDSIAVNGICLTVEAFDAKEIQFTVGYETLKVMGLTPETLSKKIEDVPTVGNVNLERSLRLGDRIHGHLVSGHVECLGTIVERIPMGEGLQLTCDFPVELNPYFWKKGSVVFHGVSLTLNEVELAIPQGRRGKFSVCLIPETMKRTNLNLLRVGDLIHLEPDYIAKAIAHQWAISGQSVGNQWTTDWPGN